MSADVIVVGSVNVDLVMRVARIPKLGETVADGRFVRRRGGKGANQAVAAARLGAEVRMVGCVGQDAEGRYALDGLRDEGVDSLLVAVRPNAATGAAVILVDGHGDNLIVVAPGANGHVALGSGFDAALDDRPGVLLASLEVPLAVVQAAVVKAAAAGWQVIVNPAPAPLEDLRWPAAAVLTPNERELQAISGEQDVEVAARSLAAATGCRIVATLGADGVLLCDAGPVERVDGVAVQCVDTTGAGDAFNGALAAGMAGGMSLADAAVVANTAAAFSTETAGAQEGLLTGLELRRRLGA